MTGLVRQADPGLQDLITSLGRWRDWLLLGWSDFSNRHRRTLIGPFWQTIQVGVWILGLTLIFRRTEGREVDYVAYVALGVTFWNFFSSTITSGASVYTRRAELILNLRNPLLLYAFRGIVDSLATLGFQLLVYLVILVFSPGLLNRAALMFLPALMIIIYTAFWVAPLMGIIGARFHDVPHLVTVVMRFLFFASPVFWVAHGEHGARTLIATYNPFTHFLEIVRAPLLGQIPSTTSWIVVLCITLPGSLLSVLLFRRYRQSVVFWV